MRLAASVTSATGSTTLLMNTMLDTYTMPIPITSRHTATPTVISSSLDTADMEVTYRMAPTTWSSSSNGAHTDMICSPVWGSTPRKGSICLLWKALMMSGVSGAIPAVRP